MFEALQDNGYGEFDGAILAFSSAQRETGLAALKTRAEVAMTAAVAVDETEFCGI